MTHIERKGLVRFTNNVIPIYYDRKPLFCTFSLAMYNVLARLSARSFARLMLESLNRDFSKKSFALSKNVANFALI